MNVSETKSRLFGVGVNSVPGKNLRWEQGCRDQACLRYPSHEFTFIDIRTVLHVGQSYDA